MVIFQISLFGQFEVRYKKEILLGIKASKMQELLCYLLLYRDRPHPREGLANLWWGNMSTSKSKRYLRKTLWQLQAYLDLITQPHDPQILRVEPEWVQITLGDEVWLDVAEFEAAFTLTQGRSGQSLYPNHIQALQEAVELYVGDLLEGWYQDWCLFERERFQHMYLIMLDKLMSYCEASAHFEQGLIYGDLILRYDSAREQTHRRLMRLHYLAGDRTAALRQYQRCVSALDEEFAVKPAKRTESLYAAIKSDRFPDAAQEMAADLSRPNMSVPSLVGFLDCLKHHQMILANLQKQVDLNIKIVQSILNEQR